MNTENTLQEIRARQFRREFPRGGEAMLSLYLNLRETVRGELQMERLTAKKGKEQ